MKPNVYQGLENLYLWDIYYFSIETTHVLAENLDFILKNAFQKPLPSMASLPGNNNKPARFQHHIFHKADCLGGEEIFLIFW